MLPLNLPVNDVTSTVHLNTQLLCLNATAKYSKMFSEFIVVKIHDSFSHTKKLLKQIEGFVTHITLLVTLLALMQYRLIALEMQSLCLY